MDTLVQASSKLAMEHSTDGGRGSSEETEPEQGKVKTRDKMEIKITTKVKKKRLKE